MSLTTALHSSSQHFTALQLFDGERQDTTHGGACIPWPRSGWRNGQIPAGGKSLIGTFSSNILYCLIPQANEALINTQEGGNPSAKNPGNPETPGDDVPGLAVPRKPYTRPEVEYCGGYVPYAGPAFAPRHGNIRGRKKPSARFVKCHLSSVAVHHESRRIHQTRTTIFRDSFKGILFFVSLHWLWGGTDDRKVGPQAHLILRGFLSRHDQDYDAYMEERKQRNRQRC